MSCTRKTVSSRPPRVDHILNGEKDMQDWGTLLAAAIAAAVAVFGYVINQNADRRAKKAQFYAEALRAVKELEEMPYRVAKRKDSSPETREKLGSEISDIFVDISFYLSWLRIDSSLIGEAYALMARSATSACEQQLRYAWGLPIITDDKDVGLDNHFFGRDKSAQVVCVAAMHNELKLSAPFFRKSIRVMIDKCARELRERPYKWVAPINNS
jgi:NTP pyrophosphatase (non-canonical NTP hydrolase)